MKTSNVHITHSMAIIQGWVDPLAANGGGGSDGSVIDVDVGNGDVGALVAGDVVVLQSDGSVAKTTTERDTRPVGVVLDDIAVGEFGAVAWAGPVDLINVVASVTAGDFAATSTTGGDAESVGTTPGTGTFGYFTSSGTTPSGFLIGFGGGGLGGGAETVFDHGNMGSTETVDLADGTWHRGTLNANCTITVTGFTVDEGLVCVFEVTQDGTGGWAITWDPDVIFIGDDQPDLTAGATTVFLLFSSEGDSLIYGAKVGGGLSSSSFATPAVVLGTAAAAGVATTVIRSDSTIVAFDATVPTTQAFGDAAATGSAAVAARRDHKHGMPAAPASTTDHEHIGNVQFNGDGVTTAFELPAAPFDAYSVAAFVAGVLQDVTLSGTMLTTMTFLSAPASGTGNIQAYITAVVA